jgi:type I restriction enzyme, S subunit
MRDGWIIKQLEEVCTKFGAGPFGSNMKVSTFVDDGIPVVSGIHMTELELVEETFNYITVDHANRMQSSIVQRNDVVITKAGTIGQVSLIPENSRFSKYVLSSRQLFARPNVEYVIPKYLAIYLKYGRGQDQILSNVNRTGVPSLSQAVSFIKNVRIELPPLPEQKRIVDLISSVDSYIEALQQQLESAKNSKRAYVNTIVSEIFARGKKIKIADIAEVKGGKRLPKGTPWSEEPTDHRYIRATDIKDGIVLTENLVYVPDDVWPLISRYVVNQGDVVITIAGTIGQVGVIPTSLEGVNLTENAAKIVVNKKLVRSNYLSMLLGSNYYQQDIDSKTKKTTQPKLGLNMINSIEIPLPDLAEQDEIFSVVSQIDTLIAGTNNLILQTIALRTGLLSDLLSGVHEIPASYDKIIGAA